MVGIVVIAASAGGFVPLRTIIGELPVPCLAAIFVVVHIGRHPSLLPKILSSAENPATFPEDGDLVEMGHVYVAPPDHHMFIERDVIRISRGPKVHYTRPAADFLFISAAQAHGSRVMGIVLSGGDGDGAAGLRTIAEHGGIVLVQDPTEAIIPSMPRAALQATPMAGRRSACLSVDAIAQRVRSFCSCRPGGEAA
jgi:two-component system chemotaxis response regulator CheB